MEEERKRPPALVQGHDAAKAPSQKKQKTEGTPSLPGQQQQQQAPEESLSAAAAPPPAQPRHAAVAVLPGRAPVPATPLAEALDNIVKMLKEGGSFAPPELEKGYVEPVLYTFRGREYPTRWDGSTAGSNITPDLLLYTLTDEGRYNGAATSLRDALELKPLLVHGLSGAGKTRAMLDVLANNDSGEQGSWEYGVYIDLGNLASGQLPSKNFPQIDVKEVKDGLVEDVDYQRQNNTQAMHRFMCLILARVVLLYLLKGKGFDGCHLLYAQLGIGRGGDQLLQYSRTVLVSLLKWSPSVIRDLFSTIRRSILVVIDEANVALYEMFGTYRATTKANQNISRPVLSPLYEVLSDTRSVLAGTNMSFGDVLSSVVSQMAEGQQKTPFNNFTSLHGASMVSLASQHFGLSMDPEDASILKGRCRFFMLAINVWLTNQGMESFVDAIASAAADLQDVRNPNSPLASVHKFVQRHKGNRAALNHITDNLLTSFIEGKESALVYEPNTDGIREDQRIVNEVVDTSIATTAKDTYDLVLKEPVVVFGLIGVLGQQRVWDPADSMIRKMCLNQNQNPSMMGFMFEYVVACLLIPNFPAVMKHLQGKEKFAAIPGWVLELGRSSQTHFQVTNSHYRDFSKSFQMEKVCFPPSKPSGPDILAWLVAGALQALLSVQCKLYQDVLKNALTKAAVATLNKSSKSSVRILFTGKGAEGTAAVKVAGRSVTITLEISDIVDLPAVAKIGAVYRAKYGESFSDNLDEYEADNSEDASEEEEEEEEEEEGVKAGEAQAMDSDQDGTADGDS